MAAHLDSHHGLRWHRRLRAGVAVGPMMRTSWLRPRPAGSPEPPYYARSCSRLPRASASLGQSAAWAALAGLSGLVLDIELSEHSHASAALRCSVCRRLKMRLRFLASSDAASCAFTVSR